jgi:cell division protein FtsZ
MINVDFSHIRRLMKLGGGALMAIGYGQGESMANKAIEQALHHPMIDSVPLEHAAGIIANFTGGPDLALFEVEEALMHLQEQTSSQTEIVLGIINDERLEGRVQVTLIVTGLGAPTLEEALSKVSKPSPVEAKAEPPVGRLAGFQLPPSPPASPFTSASFSPPHAKAPSMEPSSRLSFHEPLAAGAAESSLGSPFNITPNAADIDLPAFLRRRMRTGG